jgi:hypothetical protein
MTPWKLLPMLPMQTAQVAFRQFENGRQESCLVTTEQFKKDLADGVELQDPDGKLIDGLAYLATLNKEQQ